MKIGIINISGNVKNVTQVLNKIGYKKFNFIEDPESLKKIDTLIFPGVGSFGKTIEYLHKNNLFNEIIKHIKNNKPYVGICLGFQVLFKESDESKDVSGLSIFKNKIVKINVAQNERHIKNLNVGWRKVNLNECPKLNSFLSTEKKKYFYFMHNYYLSALNQSVFDEFSFISYGKNKICSHIIKNNIFAFQFHLERSGDVGIELFKKVLNNINQKNFQKS